MTRSNGSKADSLGLFAVEFDVMGSFVGNFGQILIKISPILTQIFMKIFIQKIQTLPPNTSFVGNSGQILINSVKFQSKSVSRGLGTVRNCVVHLRSWSIYGHPLPRRDYTRNIL